MTLPFSKPGERHVVLSHVSAALRDVSVKDAALDVPIHWAYGVATGTAAHADKPDRSAVITRFIERCKDYKAEVIRVASEDALPTALAADVKTLGLQSLVVPHGLEPGWLDGFSGSGLHIVQDAPPLSKQELSTIDGVLTGCALGIAETGTIALDHSSNQGRRIITLLPHTHLCVVRASDIVSSVPEAVQLLKPSLASGQPATWISGPSATVDIEFTRVEGVHGPHTLRVFIVD